MTVSAKLGTCDLVVPFPGRREPGRNTQSRDGILAHAHRADGEAVNHVQPGDMGQHRFVHGHNDIPLHHHVIFCVGVVFPINPEGVNGCAQGRILLAHDPVNARVVGIPVELLCQNMNDGRFLFRRRPGDHFGPEWNREADQQNALHQRDETFEVIRDVTLDANVIGFRVLRLAEPENGVKEIRQPAHKKRAHQGMDVNNQVVHVLAMLGRKERQVQELFFNQVIKSVCHRSNLAGWFQRHYRVRPSTRPFSPDK